MNFLDQPTRNLFFTGKGGVGKTSVACATAIQLADVGKKVLLISTDPASNLDEVLQVALSNRPRNIPGVPGLFALNLDPELAAAEYRERMVGPYRSLLPPAAITSMEEQFSGSCTLEIAAFDEFSKLLGDPAATSSYDHILFDTAPTGHTLRLLTLPSAWSGFMANNTTGTSCLGPLAGLQQQQQLYHDTVRAISDPQTTTLVLVTRAEPAAMREAARTSGELAALAISNQHLVINGLFRAVDDADPIARAMQARGDQALVEMPQSLRSLPQTVVPLQASELLGVASLRAMTTAVPPPLHSAESPTGQSLPSPLNTLIDDFAQAGHGVILTMGKGGVGKTTIAAAIAVELARRGLRVHLSTTDPAAHIASTLASTTPLPLLTVGRIDPAEETARYSAEVMSQAGAGLDAQGRALLAEDLRSPCTEEIAVFRAFAETVAAGDHQIVVLDTAPTGHTILLLDAALAHHREVTRQASTMPPAVTQLLPRLRNPDYTRILLVTLPAATPVHEAAQLQHDLRRAQMEPYAWVINQSLASLPIRDPLLRRRQIQETCYIDEVTTQLAQRTVLVDWRMEPPVGEQRLRALLRRTPMETIELTEATS